MTTENTNLLFSWENVELLPDLQRLKLILDTLPSEAVIAALKARRGHGRNDFPVAAMFNALIGGIVFQHPSSSSLLHELHRGEKLAQLCGFNPLLRQSAPHVQLRRRQDGRLHGEWISQPMRLSLPNEWNWSRFLHRVIELEHETGLLSAMVEKMRRQLMDELPDFGRYLGYDGKAVKSHSTGRVNKVTGRTSDADADWGQHKTCGVDKNGRAWNKIKKWFGYRWHMISDTEYEIPVAITVTAASCGEGKQLRRMLHQLMDEEPKLAQRAQQFTVDRGLDHKKIKTMLWDDYEIRPIIDLRKLWRVEKQDADYDPGKTITRQLNGGKCVDNILYSETGTVYCQCPKSSERRQMYFQGFEKDRNALKYRCPVAASDFECEGWQECHQQSGSRALNYGRSVRIKLEDHNRRTAAERIFSRVDQVYCFDRHYIRGLKVMQARASLAVAVMMAMALAQVRAGRPQQMGSLLQPIPILDSG